jgi:hypothetical protein
MAVLLAIPTAPSCGDRSMSRWEFAAGLNACLQQIERLIAQGNNISQADFDKLQRLSKDFEAELATIKGRVNNLETRLAFLEERQFSTTTKLRGQTIWSINDTGAINILTTIIAIAFVDKLGRKPLLILGSSGY